MMVRISACPKLETPPQDVHPVEGTYFMRLYRLHLRALGQASMFFAGILAGVFPQKEEKAGSMCACLGSPHSL